MAAEGFWKKCQRNYLAKLEAAAKKKEEDEKIKKTLEKLQQNNAHPHTSAKKRVKVTQDEYEEEEEEQQPNHYDRQKKYERRRAVLPKKDIKKREDYLKLCKGVVPVMNSLPKGQCSKVYPLLSKKYKRSLRQSATEMFKGSLYKHMTDEEKKIFRDNKESVKKLLRDEDLACNAFDDDMAPVSKAVLGLVDEMEDTTSGTILHDKGKSVSDEEDSDWKNF